jgi:hypothetical protein
MLRECLVSSSMRLGVPFIAPRQLGAVESIPGRQFLPSVAWRTGQSGAPPDTVRCGFLSFFGEADRWRFRAVGAPDTVRCGSLSLFGEADRCRFRAVGAPDTVRCTPDSPVPLLTVGTCHASRADSAADCWLTGQSGAPPDSPVIYSRTPPLKSREQLVRICQPGAPDTVRCTTEQSSAPRLSRLLAASSHAFPIVFSLILTLRQTC